MERSEIVTMSAGNPGAAVALSSLLNIGANDALNKLKRLDIIGTDAYVVWSDICNKDTEKTEKLILITDGEKLKLAASKQDYSGRDILSDELGQI